MRHDVGELTSQTHACPMLYQMSAMALSEARARAYRKGERNGRRDRQEEALNLTLTIS